MDKEQVWTSTGIKLLHHPDLLMELKGKRAFPISLQVAPTSNCQLNCLFCSNTNRSKNENLDRDALIHLIKQLKYRGLKTVEWTGGGDPTLYPHINEMVRAAKEFDLKQGFITNGISLIDKISPYSILDLSWIRISMNSLDYKKKIQIPVYFKGALGFSYVMNDLTTEDTLKELHEYVEEYKPKYVRIVPNCQSSDEQQIENNRKYSELVGAWGEPYFYQKKEFERPARCWWGYLKPFALHDGFIYRCSSVVLNDNADRHFHHRYRWCSIDQLPKKYDVEMESFSSENCHHCVFKRQNDLIDCVLNPNGMEEFV